MSISSSVNKLNVSEQTKEILKNRYELNINRDRYNVSLDPNLFLRGYEEVKVTLKEFGYNGSDEEIAQFFLNIYCADLRKKCLIFESLRCFDIVMQGDKEVFKRSAENIYAKVKFYNELKQQGDSRIDNLRLNSFIKRNKRIEEEFGVTSQELQERYPLTKQKLQLMERIHNAKKNAQTKSGGVSL